jgi:hypothetical protein
MAGIQVTINSVWTIARRLHQFFSLHCRSLFETNTFSECFNLNRTNLIKRTKNFLQEELLHVSPALKKHHSNMFSLWVGTERTATWEKGIGLIISKTVYFQNYQSYWSRINCTVFDQNGGYFSRNHHPILYLTVQYPWATA